MHELFHKLLLSVFVALSVACGLLSAACGLQHLSPGPVPGVGTFYSG